MSNESLLLKRIDDLKAQLEQSHKDFVSATNVIGCLVYMAGGEIEIPLTLEDKLTKKQLRTWVEDTSLHIRLEDE